MKMKLKLNWDQNTNEIKIIITKIIVIYLTLMNVSRETFISYWFNIKYNKINNEFI